MKTKPKTPQEKALRKKYFTKDEKEGIEKYEEAEHKAKGKEKQTYEKILPEEKKHLKLIKRI